VSGGGEWQESVTARADYAALLEASSKMPMNLASAHRHPAVPRVHEKTVQTQREFDKEG
jgi:hypothetical protein